MDIIKQTYARYGILGFYDGIIPSIFNVAWYRMWYWSLYDVISWLLFPYRENFWVSFFRGWSVTCLTNLVCNPLEVIRYRMIVRSAYGQKRYENFWQAFQVIFRQEGISALFSGALLQFANSVLGAVIVLGYNHAQKWFFSK